jgi:hypothetical protein
MRQLVVPSPGPMRGHSECNLALGRRMHSSQEIDFRHGRLRVGVLIRWLVRFVILEILLRRGVPIIWRKYQERRGKR